jgi:hypothetical protein
LWLFSKGEQSAACEIERLVRKAAAEPNAECQKLVEFFAHACKHYPLLEIR